MSTALQTPWALNLFFFPFQTDQRLSSSCAPVCAIAFAAVAGAVLAVGGSLKLAWLLLSRPLCVLQWNVAGGDTVRNCGAVAYVDVVAAVLGVVVHVASWVVVVVSVVGVIVFSRSASRLMTRHFAP